MFFIIYLNFICLLICLPIIASFYSWNKVLKIIFDSLKYLLRVLLLLVTIVIVLLMQLIAIVSTRIITPIVLGLLLYIFIFIALNQFEITRQYIQNDYYFKTVGYLVFTLFFFTYAHLPLFKKIYILSLFGLNKILNTEPTTKAIEKEQAKIHQNLLSIHIYILLLTTYIFFNVIDFLGFSNQKVIDKITESTFHLISLFNLSDGLVYRFVDDLLISLTFLLNGSKFITEALLTFVIIDTLVTYRKHLKKRIVI
ncbi:hypothetical protein PB01_08230 [Psychrobacillus glaciei]|uniref:Uncharacterized protein n=1 Tax=Psychrobacillus glaciei TaxID=2283160 RepID=A0A5J6SLF2_9BACI|nr:hypothetical protein PB01_08230 [Psychrobacillus glaciei]